MNLSGTLKSIQQGMTNTKIPFARTPKVNNRTASPALYVTMPWVIIIYSCMVFYADTLSHNWGNAVFAGFNAIVTFWALTAYIGIWHSVQDMVLGLIRWFFVPIKEPQQEAAHIVDAQGFCSRILLSHHPPDSHPNGSPVAEPGTASARRPETTSV